MLGASVGSGVESQLDKLEISAAGVDMDLNEFKDAAVPPLTIDELVDFQVGFKTFGGLAINMANAINVNELRGADRV
jgi:hypothetical protein